MKVLWLCNIVLPDFSNQFGFKNSNAGGWMTGMLHQLEKKADIAVCCPIINIARAKDGVYNGHNYYSFAFYQSEYNIEVKQRFKEIISQFRPDIIHIWGTEYPHTLAMINACEEMHMLDKVIINIQGLVSVCARHYYSDIPDKYIECKLNGYPSIKQECEDFIKKGLFETEALKKVHNVIGRTDWDEACTKQINPTVHYYFCNEILRDIFYQYKGKWNYDKCQKHSLFVSQANYPIKGLHYLLEAAPDILLDYPDTHIYVGGTDPCQPDSDDLIKPYGLYLKMLIQKYDLSEHITFLGSLSDEQMVDRYLKSNIFVSASTIENESNSISEAVMTGCPVISSYVGGVTSRCRGNVLYVYQHDAPYMLAYYIKKAFKIKHFETDSDNMFRIVDPQINADNNYKIYQHILK